MDLAPILLVAIIFGGVGVAAYFALADAGAPDLPSIRLPRAVARFLRTPKGTLSAIFGALLLVAGILLYDFDFLTLVSFGFIFGAHFILGWIYLFAASFFLPRIPPLRKNPFRTKR